MTKYILALLCPPLAVLMCFKPFQFVICIALTVTTYWMGAIQALLVVYSYHLKIKERKERLDKVINEQMIADRKRSYTI